jgi:hypothetical protein
MELLEQRTRKPWNAERNMHKKIISRKDSHLKRQLILLLIFFVRTRPALCSRGPREWRRWWL